MGTGMPGLCPLLPDHCQKYDASCNPIPSKILQFHVCYWWAEECFITKLEQGIFLLHQSLFLRAPHIWDQKTPYIASTDSRQVVPHWYTVKHAYENDLVKRAQHWYDLLVRKKSDYSFAAMPPKLFLLISTYM